MTMTNEELVNRRVSIDEQIDRLTGEKNDINEQLREKFTYGNTAVGDYAVNIQHNRRLDTAAIEARFPVAVYPHLYEAKLKTAALKDNFAPVELEKFQIEGAAKVLIK